MELVTGAGSSKFTATQVVGDVASWALSQIHRRMCRKSRDRDNTPMPSVLDILMDWIRQRKVGETFGCGIAITRKATEQGRSSDAPRFVKICDKGVSLKGVMPSKCGMRSGTRAVD